MNIKKYYKNQKRIIKLKLEIKNLEMKKDLYISSLNSFSSSLGLYFSISLPIYLGITILSEKSEFMESIVLLNIKDTFIPILFLVISGFYILYSYKNVMSKRKEIEKFNKDILEKTRELIFLENK